MKKVLLYITLIIFIGGILYIGYKCSSKVRLSTQSVADIFNDRKLTGCHDVSLVFSSILRHYGFTTLMVMLPG